MPLLLALLGGLLPLAMLPGFTFHYDVTPKTVLLALAVSAALLRVRKIPAEFGALRRRRSGRALVWCIALSSIGVALSAAFSSRLGLSLLGSGWRELGAATAVALLLAPLLAAAYLCARPKRVALLLRACVCAGLIVSVYGIGQYFGIDPWQTSAGYRALDGDAVIVRPPGTFGHADYFGWWLAVEFFCAVAVAGTERRLWRAVGVTAAGLSLIAATLTGTRSALLALAIGGSALLLLAPPSWRKRFAVSATVGAVLTILFVLSPAGRQLRARAAWAAHEPVGGARPLLWRDSVRMAGAKPWTGFGPETFPAEFARWESADLARLYPEFHHESPHNLVLDFATSAGVPGLLTCLAWAGMALIAAWGALKARSTLAPPLVAGVLASAVASMFSAAVIPPLLLTLLVLAILIASEGPDRVAGVPERRSVWAGFGVPVAAALAVFACVLGVSDYRLEKFQLHPGVEGYNALLRIPAPVAAEDIFCSRTLFQSCLESMTGPSRYQCWTTAVHAAARATFTADDPANAWYNLAQFTAAQNDISGTKGALAMAIRVAPNWFKPHRALAALLSRTGDPASSRVEAERARSLGAALSSTAD